MKKRFRTLLICLCAVLGTIASAYGSAAQVNALISKGYLEGIYRQELQALVSAQTTARLTAVRDAALQALSSVGENYLSQLLPDEEGQPDWISAGDLLAQVGVAGDTITLNTGAGIIWTEGSASFTGTLIDITSGEERTEGTMAANHRYVAPEQVLITVIGDHAAWSVEGEWLTTGKNEESEPVQPPEPTVVFSDVREGAWYYDSVYYVVERGLFYGTGDGTTFEPDLTMTRSMMTAVLYRMSGSPEVEYSPIFTDVPEGAWYTAGTIWAGQNKIVSGTGNDMFNPNGALTREQIAQMLYNYAKWLALDTSVQGDVSIFSDAASISNWASDAMSWAVGVGLFKGSTNNTLLPTEAATRAQVASLLQRFDLWMFDQM